MEYFGGSDVSSGGRFNLLKNSYLKILKAGSDRDALVDINGGPDVNDKFVLRPICPGVLIFLLKLICAGIDKRLI